MSGTPKPFNLQPRLWLRPIVACNRRGTLATHISCVAHSRNSDSPLARWLKYLKARSALSAICATRIRYCKNLGTGEKSWIGFGVVRIFLPCGAHQGPQWALRLNRKVEYSSINGRKYRSVHWTMIRPALVLWITGQLCLDKFQTFIGVRARKLLSEHRSLLRWEQSRTQEGQWHHKSTRKQNSSNTTHPMCRE